MSKRPIKSALGNGLCIIANGGDVEIHEDSYEQGELEYVNSWNIEINGYFDTVEEFIAALSKELYWHLDPAACDFGEGVFRAYLTVNAENEEPSEYEYEQWKKGELMLYTADIFVPLECGPRPEKHDMTDDEARSFGFEVWSS